jgi:heat shock protein HslJ
VLTSLNGKGPLAGTEITLSFEDGKVSGSAGCNTYFGAYKVEGEDKLTFSDLANTEMACLEPEGIMEQETQYLGTLRGATGLRLSDGELQIFSAGGGVLVFSRS